MFVADKQRPAHKHFYSILSRPVHNVDTRCVKNGSQQVPLTQHMLLSGTSYTKCAFIHPLINSLQHSEREEPGRSQGHKALHHCGMMGSSCSCWPARQLGTAWLHVASITLTERRKEGTDAPLLLGNWYQMVPPLWGPDLRAGRVPGHLRADLEDGQTAVFCQWARGPRRSSFSTHTVTYSRRRNGPKPESCSIVQKLQHSCICYIITGSKGQVRSSPPSCAMHCWCFLVRVIPKPCMESLKINGSSKKMGHIEKNR